MIQDTVHSINCSGCLAKNKSAPKKIYSYFLGMLPALIYSSINDNWKRVVLIHSIARDLYASTAESDFRNRTLNNGNFFPFDFNAYRSMEDESRIVGMVMAWSVVTLESLVNHQLAVILNNKILATMAIEYPAQVTDKLRISKSAKSELAKKLIILLNDRPMQECNGVNIIKLADSLADRRNAIVHDKPFRVIDYGDGEFDFQWYRSRGQSEPTKVQFEDLVEFYANCDKVAGVVLATSPDSPDCEIAFGSLMR